MITPSLAREPYNAEAAAPFKTDMLSISSGLMLERPSPPSEVFPPPLTPIELSDAALPGLVPKLVLSIGTPLTTISGLFWPEIEDCPRIRILEVPAGPVPNPEILTPAIFPESEFIRFGVRFTVSWSEFTFAVAYPRLLLDFLIPRAVTTTSSRASTSGTNLTSIVVCPV